MVLDHLRVPRSSGGSLSGRWEVRVRGGEMTTEAEVRLGASKISRGGSILNPPASGGQQALASGLVTAPFQPLSNFTWSFPLCVSISSHKVTSHWI